MFSPFFSGAKPLSIPVAHEKENDNVPRPVERMFTPVNYRVTESLEAESVGGPAPIARPEIRRDLDRRRRGSNEEGVTASKVNSSVQPKPGPGRTLTTEQRCDGMRALSPPTGPPPTPLLNTTLQACHGRSAAAPVPQVATSIQGGSVRIAPAYWANMSASTRSTVCASPCMPMPFVPFNGVHSPAPAPVVAAPMQAFPPSPLPAESQAPLIESKKTAEVERAGSMSPPPSQHTEASPPAAKTATWREVVADIRSEAHDAYFVCIMGGAETPGTGTVMLLSSLAQELISRLPRSVIFVVGGSQGVPQAFSDGLAETDSDRVWKVTEGWLQKRGLTPEDERTLLAQLGDVYVFVEGTGDASWVAREAAQRGADLVPIRRSGGASSGLFDFPPEALRRPPFVGEACWALLADTSAPIAAASAAASAAVAGALANRCRRQKQPLEVTASSVAAATGPVAQACVSPPMAPLPDWAKTAVRAVDKGLPVSPDVDKTDKKSTESTSAPLSFTPSVWSTPGGGGSMLLASGSMAAPVGALSPPRLAVPQGALGWNGPQRLAASYPGQPTRCVFHSGPSFRLPVHHSATQSGQAMPQLKPHLQPQLQPRPVPQNQSFTFQPIVLGEGWSRPTSAPLKPWAEAEKMRRPPLAPAPGWQAPAGQERPRGLYRSSSEIILGPTSDSDERVNLQKPRASSPFTTRSHAKYFGAGL
mmetsp:Transcript_4905/g.11461  ORF Transcript_4905/g.11461 Transcript_4905/m.11461 type:complete len:703 (+) Transcript_4905:88-2196(+)